MRLKEKIQKNISKAKKGLPSKKLKQTDSFHEQINTALEVHFNPKDNGALLKCIKAVVIGSPGHYKNYLLEYLQKQCDKNNSTTLKQLLSLTILS